MEHNRRFNFMLRLKTPLNMFAINFKIKHDQTKAMANWNWNGICVKEKLKTYLMDTYSTYVCLLRRFELNPRLRKQQNTAASPGRLPGSTT